MSEILLDVRGLHVRLPASAERSHALSDVNVRLSRGELLCVVGESGSGKSTLGSAILGLLAPGLRVEAGTVQLAGRNLLALTQRELRDVRGRDIALVAQDPLAALNPLQRIGAQIDEALQLHTSLSRRDRQARVLELLGYVDLPRPVQLRRVYPFQLSGGQRQRVAIAIALACEPRLLIADEVTSALDAATRTQILDLLQRIRRDTGMAVLLITHDFAVVRAVADRVLVMRHGQVVEEGECRQVLENPQADYTRSLLAATRLQPRSVSEVGDAAPLLEARDLHKRHWQRHGLRRQAITALDGVSLQLRPGETLGIVGESGSGKSTLARALLRLLPLDQGSIRLAGRELLDLDERSLRAVRSDIQMVFQDPSASFNPRRRVGDALIDGLLVRGVGKVEAERQARELLESVGLPASAYDAYPHSFSGGQRQRIAIARALLPKPRVLVADECVSALDALIQVQILELLERLQAQLGLSIIFITHDLGVAARLCDRVLVMHQGKVVENAITPQLLAAPQHPYTRTLLAAHAGYTIAATDAVLEAT
ncbi:dipeptide ABC transporter ATP-binding protein [Phytopseudomonas dryadis]|uniref:ABC-type dipeptide transporter n=1 Tax=Phytopseudomonas dryadis TaxID=2487520 RepID=A0A4Q9RAD7_9GAMM|nr:ABC transporter ATP-binding protein [Pseudomonas dryadis]TBU97527.1 microcin ABC transporter ATP-binding protein [Pseudomonas dryadis]